MATAVVRVEAEVEEMMAEAMVMEAVGAVAMVAEV